MTWRVEAYEPGWRDTWNALVRKAKARHFMFEREYMEYHADRFLDASLLIFRRKRPIAVLPASRHDDVVISHGGLTFGALLYDEELTAAAAVETLSAVTGHLRDAGLRRWIYKPLPHIYHVSPAEEDLFALTIYGARLVRREVTAVVASGGSVSYSTERRRAIKKGTEHDLDLRRSFAFEEFMALERALLLNRHGVEPVHTGVEMELLAERFPDAIKLFAAHDSAGEIIAGVVVFETATVAHAQYIGASEQGRELHAQDALFVYLIEDVYSGKPWFDFGISNKRDGTLNHGLMRNKEGFGARSVVHDRYVLDLS